MSVSKIQFVPMTLQAAGLVFQDRIGVPLCGTRNPATTAAGRATMAWLGEMGLLSICSEAAFRRARFQELMGHIYLQEDAKALALCAQFAATIFALDDLLDDTAARPLRNDPTMAWTALDELRRSVRMGRPSRSFEVVPPSERPGLIAVSKGLCDLTRRLLERGASVSGFLHQLDIYLRGTALETCSRRSGSYGSIDAYARERAAFSAVDLAVELGLALRGVERSELPAAWEELALCTNLHVSYVNDLYSYAKERSNGEVSNIVAVLEDVEGLSMHDAMARACRMVDALALRFVDLREGCSGPAVELLECWMRGSYEWHGYQTTRYTECISVAPRSLSEARLHRTRAEAERIAS